MKTWKFVVKSNSPLEIPADLIEEAGLKGEIEAIITPNGINLRCADDKARDEEFYKAICEEFGGFIYG